VYSIPEKVLMLVWQAAIYPGSKIAYWWRQLQCLDDNFLYISISKLRVATVQPDEHTNMQFKMHKIKHIQSNTLSSYTLQTTMQ